MTIRNAAGLLRPALVAFGAFVLGALHADAATFEVDFSGGANTVIGTFEAPVAGGLVSNFMVTLMGVTFDMPSPASGVLSYDPSITEFTYAGSFASFINSAPNAACMPADCFLEIYPDPDPLVPGDYLAVDGMLNNIDAGTKYIINPAPVDAPIPVPASTLFLLSGLGLLAWVKFRR